MNDRSASIVLSPEQIDLLRQELSRDDLSIYTVVIMARHAVEQGRYADAVSRLRVDADKIRMHSRELYELINY
ncbi:TPA: hypothetical protein ACQQJB_003643 [Pseudomonas aeruginosa]